MSQGMDFLYTQQLTGRLPSVKSTDIIITHYKTWTFKNTKQKPQNKTKHTHQNKDFPCGPVVKNLPANAGDKGSILGLRRFPHAAEQLNPRATTTKPMIYSLWAATAEAPCLEPMLGNKRSRCNERRPLAAIKCSPHPPQLEKSPCNNKDPAQPKINK